MKKISVILIAAMVSIFMVGCGEKKSEKPQTNAVEKNETQATTMGGKLVQIFEKEIKQSTDLLKVAETVANSEECGLDCVVSEMNEGYFPGMSAEVKGFKKAVSFAPMIGSIPFVGYIFEADNAKDFESNLLSMADPRWNICTEAEETVSKVVDNFVFFAMCPGEDF